MGYLDMRRRARQKGVAAVEFSLVVMVFLIIIFATLELARIEYLLNTVMEVTRRATAAAANVSFKDTAALKAIQAEAVFRSSSGPLALGDPVTADNVMIDYLSVSKDTLDFQHMTTLPSSPARNRWNCIADPNGDNCIRFVRARVCESMDDSGNCKPLAYQQLFPFFDLSGWHLPVAETIVPAGSLGYTVGSMP
jgi:hypothetical protein